MRLAALIPAFALCLTPFASAQSSDQDLRAAIRKIVREEIQAALKDMHQPMVLQGHQIAVPGMPAGSLHVTTKAKPANKGVAITLDDVSEGQAHVLNLDGMKGMKVVEGHPIELELSKLLEGKLEGLLGNVQVKVFHEESDDDDDKGGEGEHEHEGKGHGAKKAMTFHAGPGTMVFQVEGDEGKEGQSPLIRFLKAHENTAAEAVKAAAECCEVAKEAESCCEAAKEATKASTCCEGEKCAECVIEVAPVLARPVPANKAEKAEKKAKKTGKKKAKKAKPVENEEFELKIG
jgi:hypothetical protein